MRYMSEDINLWQRGLIYTEHKLLGRLNKMWDPFFLELSVIPSANVFQLVCYTASITHRGYVLEGWAWSASCSP